MAEKKKQHYVSRFYLKNFSSHEGKSINLFNIPCRRMILNGNLKNQCYRSYLYGKDGKVETLLQNIESRAALIIRDIIHRRHLPRPQTEQHFELFSIVILQWGRTLAAGVGLNEGVDQLYQHALKEQFAVYAQQRGIAREHLDGSTLGYDDPERVSVSLAAQAIPAAMDLGFKVLERKTSVEFITSDNPVLLYNQFAHGRVPGSSTGFRSQGLQIFLPLSSDLTLLIYDSSTYKVGDRRQHFVPINERDVRTLNLLQAIIASENLYFASNSAEAEVLCTARRALAKRDTSQSGLRVVHQAKTEELIQLYRKEVNYQAKFGFNKLLRDSAVALNGHLPFRRHAQKGSSDSSGAFYAGRADFVNPSEEGGELNMPILYKN